MILEKWPYIGDLLWGPAAQSPLVTRAICSRHAAYVGFMGPSVVKGPTAVGALVGGAGPWHGWLPGPALCSGCWPTGGWRWVLECWLQSLEGPGTDACPLFGGAGFLHGWLLGVGHPWTGAAWLVGGWVIPWC